MEMITQHHTPLLDDDIAISMLLLSVRVLNDIISIVTADNAMAIGHWRASG